MDSQSSNKLYLGIFIAVILALGGIGLLLVLNMKNNQPSTVNSPQSTVNRQPSTVTSPSSLPKPVAGSFLLQVENKQNQIATGQTVTVDLIADSHNSDIVGYDALLKFDATNIDVVDVHSISPDFGLMQYVKEGVLIITGIKNISVESPHVWKSIAIASVTFKPKTKGSYTFSLEKEVGKRTTKFVDTQNNLVYPETGNVMVTVN